MRRPGLSSAGVATSPATRPRSRRGLTYWRRVALKGYAFIAPQMLGFLVFILGPIVAVFWFSLHDWHLIYKNFDFRGLGNFTDMADDPLMPTVVRNSLVFALGYVPLVVGLGLVLAVALNRALRGIAIFRTLYYLPVVVSLVAWTIVWRFILNEQGALNGFLSIVGIDGPNWLREPPLAMLSVILVQILKNAGFNMVIFLAALQGVPPELEDAARVDGADDRRVFRHITLPLITPFVFLATILAIITSLKSFSLIFLMTGGGPGDATLVLAYYIYEIGFQTFEMGYASALAVVLFLAVIGLTIVQFAIRKRWVVYES
jgi:multiple sugar transport system permease protein